MEDFINDDWSNLFANVFANFTDDDLNKSSNLISKSITLAHGESML